MCYNFGENLFVIQSANHDFTYNQYKLPKKYITWRPNILDSAEYKFVCFYAKKIELQFSKIEDH